MLENKNYIETDKMLDEAFTSSPDFSLPGNFAEMLAEKVSRKFEWEQYLKEFFIYLSVFLGIGIASAAISLMAFEYNWQKWFDFLLTNVNLILAVYVVSTFILFADRVILRYFMFKSKIETV